MPSNYKKNLNEVIKRLFDIIFALFTVLLLSPILLLSWLCVVIITQTNGLFCQIRIGQYGIPFTIYKLRTIDAKTQKVSRFGVFLRQSKLDELPQVFNILKGDMSFVGPRPDIPGYYDTLTGEARKLLLLKPGLTCEASLKYADEEALLAKQDNPLLYNDTVIFPDKIAMNLVYFHNRSFFGDMIILLRTVFRSRRKRK